MFTDNPFVPVTAFLSPSALQAYVILMVLAVVAGTAFDLYHKRSAQFFLQQRQQSRVAATRKLTGADMVAIAARTLAHDVATFGEFCNQKRRASHALMFYGFVLYLITTVVMVFGYPADPRTPVILPLLWNASALMVLVGGYWFFFFLRVNVVHDGQPPWRLVRADLEIVAGSVAPGYISPLHGLQRLEKIMDEYVGGVSMFYVTSEPLLKRGLELLHMLKEDLDHVGADSLHQLQRAWELHHRVLTAEAVTRHTLFRQETRWPGYYYRADHPKLIDPDWHVFTSSQYDAQANEWQLTKLPVHHIIS